MWGADVVGMTIVPEAFLARELEMCYQPICYLTNYAEGIREMPYREGVLFEGTLPDEMVSEVEKAKELLPGICVSALFLLDDVERNCPCSVSMKRYKESGLIGGDFKKWIKGEGFAAE
jgi:5'-methylthioadenosine phosphorylase